MPTKHTLFIADLHLNINVPETLLLLAEFLKNYTPHAEALYILGDLFEVWVGDDDSSEFLDKARQLLKKYSAKLPIYVMPGNRDFALSDKFEKQTGCKILHDPEKINLYGTPTLLTHGDILCTKDYMHLLFRKFIQHRFCVKMLLKLPLAKRQKLATVVQNFTKKCKNKKPNYVKGVQHNAILKFIKKYQVEQIIHGHTHQIAIEDFTFNNQNIKRICLGEWVNGKGTVLIVGADGLKQLQDF
ncbi:MAG: UDP-2,3-diacylglucosamine diphosphatase [Gammaproteobacteria bacterium]|nr:UDP-2,3-diacylglucosamine diphosphatase [Gammaproteobacteria bacterium]